MAKAGQRLVPFCTSYMGGSIRSRDSMLKSFICDKDGLSLMAIMLLLQDLTSIVGTVPFSLIASFRWYVI